MDITPGEFKDFYAPSSAGSARSSRSRSRISSKGNFSCSMELLSPELDEIKKFDNHYINGQEKGNTLDDEDSPQWDVVKNDHNKHIVSCSISSHSTHSSLHSDENDEQKYTRNDTESDDNDDQYDSDLREAIKKMRKLDRILMKKIKHEKEVKRQRIVSQKHFHADLAKLEAQKEGGTYGDVANNTEKYLALLPPPQQLDVLLERHESSDDFEPIFQTQLHLNEPAAQHQELSSRSVKKEKVRPNSSGECNKINDEEIDDEIPTKPSSAGSNRQHKSQDRKTNFIKRNIELAKDAGNYVAMTEDEKKRLNELLDGIDEISFDSNEELEAFTQIAAMPSGEGYTPEPDEMKQLEEIDQKLQTLLSPALYNSIASTPRPFQRFHNLEMFEIGQKISKSNVIETLNPSQRMEEIEERLSKLDDKWKEECDVHGPRLTEDQLHHLLEECSSYASSDSISRSYLNTLDFHDDSSHTSSCSSAASTATSATFLLDDASRLSFHSELTTEHDNASIYSNPTSLTRETLDKLLIQARSSLGLLHDNQQINDSDHNSDCSL